MIDDIFSFKHQKIYATIDYEKDGEIAYFYRGKIINDHFTDALYDLIMDYSGILNDMALSLLDEVEEKIQGYDLRLMNAGESIFNVEIKDRKEITFFIRYPTSCGFLAEYPE